MDCFLLLDRGDFSSPEAAEELREHYSVIDLDQWYIEKDRSDYSMDGTWGGRAS